jgi:hypothetical protein
MKTILNLSKTSDLPLLLAVTKSIFKFNFLGDKTFTGASQTWTWVGIVDEAPLITQVRAGATILLMVDSLQDCIDNDGTFFYVQATGELYVHWANGANDSTIGRQTAAIQEIGQFYANGIDKTTKGYYDNTLYEPKINSITGLGFKADPLKFGLVSQSTSSVTLNNTNGSFDNIIDTFSRGAVASIDTVSDGVSTLSNSKQRFQGYTKSLQYNGDTIQFGIEEQRFFLNGPVCPNTFASNPGVLDDKYEGKPIPVAFGDIRRGLCVPIDSDGVEKADAETITFQVADPSLGAIRAIDALYDSNGNSVTLGTINLTNCTVQYAKPADVDIDLDKFSWEGEGYDLGTGLTYNNGLDIIRFCFENFGQTPFLSSTYDITQWSIQKAANTQAVGLSIQSTRGFTEEVIEPITVSLQGVVFTKGNGQITFINRDTTLPVSATIGYDDRLGDASIVYDTSAFVSSLAVEFSRDFRNKDAILEENTDFETDVIANYGLKTRGTISPIKSVLTTRANATELSNEIMDTSATPDKLVSWETKLFQNDPELLPFDMVDLDVGRRGTVDRKLVELLEIRPNYNRYTISYKGRIISDIDDELTIANVYGDGVYGSSVYGG